MPRLYFNSRKLASKYILRFRMRIVSLPNDKKNHTRKFQIICNYIKSIALCAIDFLLEKSGKSNVEGIEVVDLRV